MIVKLLTEQHLQFVSLKEGWTGPPESTPVKITHCWKSHVNAHLVIIFKDPNNRNQQFQVGLQFQTKETQKSGTPSRDYLR